MEEFLPSNPEEIRECEQNGRPLTASSWNRLPGELGDFLPKSHLCPLHGRWGKGGTAEIRWRDGTKQDFLPENRTSVGQNKTNKTPELLPPERIEEYLYTTEKRCEGGDEIGEGQSKAQI